MGGKENSALKLPLAWGSTQAMKFLHSILVSTSIALTPPLSGAVSAQESANPVDDPKPPGLSEYTSAGARGNPAQTPGRLNLIAQLAADTPEIARGLVWRIFGPEPGRNGKLPLLATAEGGGSAFELTPGSYLVHAAFGRAGATKRITIGTSELRRERMVLDAGGLKLDAVLSGGVRIARGDVKFSIFEAQAEPGEERRLVAPDVSPKTMVRLNAGIYHVVSKYGAVNATVRSDIRVEAGKLTEAVIEHRAAQLTMKLVREPGGEAIADTQWSIFTESGDIVHESVGAFASMALIEGAYAINARNRDRNYRRDFTVVAGRNQDVEVLTTE